MNAFKMDSTKETGTSSGVMLPVVELVIAIGLFTVISIFIIRFFTSANTMSRQADSLSKGLIKAESAIELSKVYSTEEVANELGGRFDEKKDMIVAYYDKDWKVGELNSNTKYAVHVKTTNKNESNGFLKQILVTVLSDTGKDEFTPIAELRGVKYIKGGK